MQLNCISLLQFICVKVKVVLRKRTLTMEITATNSDFKRHSRADSIGILASILCAIHCLLTPVLLILLPTFGKAWAHPSTHWGMAIVVIPIAIFMMRKGYQKYAKKWVVAVGCMGIVFIVVGAILPYVEMGSVNMNPFSSSSIVGTEQQSISENGSGIPSEASG